MKWKLSLIPCITFYTLRSLVSFLANLRVSLARSCINCLFDKLRTYSRIYSKGSWKSVESFFPPSRGSTITLSSSVRIAARLEILTVYDLAFSSYVDSTSIICVQRKTLSNVMLASRIYILAVIVFFEE